MYLVRRDGLPQGPPLYKDPNANHGNTILAITGATTGFAGVVVLARIYVRAIMLKTFGADDYAIGLSGLAAGAVFACFVAEVKLGVGEHSTNPHVEGNLSTIIHWLWYHSWLLVTGISMAKISVGFFLLRLVQGRWYKRLIIGWIIFLVVFTLASIGTLIFQCLPIDGAWDPVVQSNPATKCFSNTVFRDIGLFNGAINIFTDFIFASLPIPVILPLQINLRTKISLISILSLGYFACAASIVKEVYLSNFFSNPDPFFDYSFQVWNDVELNVAIMAACLPTLKPLFASLLETANNITVATGLRRTRLGSATRHRYFIQEDTKMSPLPSRSTTQSNHPYGVVVSGGSRTFSEDGRRSFGPMSKLEQSITECDSGSEDNVPLPVNMQERFRAHLPRERERERDRQQFERPKGILRTTEVNVMVSE